MTVTPRLYQLARWGAVFGGGLALFETVTYLLTLRLGTPADYAALSFFNLLFEGAVPVAAGALAACTAGTPGAGSGSMPVPRAQTSVASAARSRYRSFVAGVNRAAVWKQLSTTAAGPCSIAWRSR